MHVPHPFPKVVANYLARLRLQAGRDSLPLAVEDVADQVGISYSSLRRIENGSNQSAPFTTIAMLARFYGVHSCGLTAYYPALSHPQETAMEKYWTVLTDEQRDIIVGNIENFVDVQKKAGVFSEPIIHADHTLKLGLKRTSHEFSFSRGSGTG